jgi:acyl-coenzyme A thioesterase 13
MSKPSSIIVKDVTTDSVAAIIDFLDEVGASDPDIHNYISEDFYSQIISGHLKAHIVERGHVVCFCTVFPAVTNYFNGVHGGAVAAFAERVAIACAKTVVGEDKEIFLGELAMSYLSAAQLNEELVIDGSVVRSGRNLTVVAIEFKMKKTAKLVYTSRATIYNMPASKL